MNRHYTLDFWNNEIVSHALSFKRGDTIAYMGGLKELLGLKKLYVTGDKPFKTEMMDISHFLMNSG